MKTYKVLLVLLTVSLITLQGCSPGGTWFPKGSANMHKQNHMDRDLKPLDGPFRPGEGCSERLGMIPKNWHR